MGDTKLRKPCEHGKYDEHASGVYRSGYEYEWCDGGKFLAEGSLVVETVDGKWPEWFSDTLRRAIGLEPEWFVGLFESK